jgi:serine/threonine protein kinase
LDKKVFGDGNGGNKVYRAINTRTGQILAYKQFGNSHDLIAEVAFYMQSGTHQHLLNPLCVNRPGSQKERPHGGLLMEWFEGEDSLSWAARSSVKHTDIVRMNSKIKETVVYIHSLGVVHADLKPENILINGRTGQMKIIDLGFAAPVNSIQPHRGNPRILAPELAGIGSGRIGFGVDWWAFGGVVAALHGQKYRKLLRNRNRPYSVVYIEKHGIEWQFGTVPVDYSPATLHLIHTLLHPDPDMRSFTLPSNLALLRSHPYFNV